MNEFLDDLRTTKPADRTYGQYLSVSNSIKGREAAEVGLPILKVAILRNYTVEPLVPVLEGEILIAGFFPVFFLGDFDSVVHEAMDSQGELYRFLPDFIVFTSWLEALSPCLAVNFLLHSHEQVRGEVDRVVAHILTVSKAVRNRLGVPILVNNFVPPTDPTLGILDSQLADGHSGTVGLLNRRVVEVTKDVSDLYVVDLARIFSAHGIYNSFDSRHWQMARTPFSPKVLAPVGREFIKYVSALKGRAKKCLVLDCDNTLWGGVIGEDGLEGIKLGPNFPGSSYVALQQEILTLHERGVILALCSKNNESDVIDVLRNHPDMVLRERHFATWRINWEDKVSNIRDLAAELNIGLDSVVFVDDNLFEVNFVRQHLPQVTAIHLAGNTADYRALLARLGLFDSLAYTPEDRRKNEMYRQNRRRMHLEGAAESLDDYLRSLGLEVTIDVPDALDVPRVSQLTQKTNQFNLTTQRYGEGQIKSLMSSETAGVFCLKVKDSVSDLGLVGVAILKYEGESAEIDSFLMSCRALGRGVETALLANVIEHAIARRSARRVVGRFFSTEKNMQVRDFYERHKFKCLERTSESSTWEFDPRDGGISSPDWIKVNVKV